VFGTTPMTAWELEADRRRELATHKRPVYQAAEVTPRRDGPAASDRRLIFGWRLTALTNRWEDARS
jgi:hypothetical protein